MKGLKGWFRLGTLTLLALTLMVALALSSSASSHQVCSSSLMLDEVEIVSVGAKPSAVHWRPQDLVRFKYNGDIENGLLEVRFKDIMDLKGLNDFDGYIIEAQPGDDDPGDSAKRGVTAHMSTLITRPTVAGDTVTEVLNLEPGTKYYVTVHAVNHNTVQISPKQHPQDSAQSSATTLLSAPFLGAIRVNYAKGNTNVDCNPLLEPSGHPAYGADCIFRSWSSVGLWERHNSDYEGTHFAFYEADNEAGQHYFRWLNPLLYGPYDHIQDDVLDYLNGDDDSKGQADMLSLDKDGKLEDHCSEDSKTNGEDYNIANGGCGHTHYQFKAVDANGNTVASELVETKGYFDYYNHYTDSRYYLRRNDNYFEVVFTAESGELTLSVSLGRMVDGKYKVMSDTASVRFKAPGDLRAFDQTNVEYVTVLSDINKVFRDNINDKGNEIAERWLGKKGSGSGRSLWNPRVGEGLEDMYNDRVYTLKYQAYLNNQLTMV